MFFAGSVALSDVLVVLVNFSQPEDSVSGKIWALTPCQFLKGKDRAKRGEKADKRNKELVVQRWAFQQWLTTILKTCIIFLGQFLLLPIISLYLTCYLAT